MKIQRIPFLLAVIFCPGCERPTLLPCKSEEAVYSEAQRIVSKQLKFPVGATFDEKPRFYLHGDTLNVMFTVVAVNAFNVPTEHLTLLDFICEDGRLACMGGLGPGGVLYGNDKGAVAREKAAEEWGQHYLDSIQKARELRFDSLTRSH